MRGKNRYRRRRSWRNAATVLAAIVVFCTTYALILPAITMEKQPTCGMEEHIHEDVCYGPARNLICCVHSHSDSCYDSSGAVVCGYADFAVHAHDDLCYGEDGTLLCTLPEIAEHVHGDACMQTQTEVHHHDDSCVFPAMGDLICTLEESGHSHDPGCMEEVRTLLCPLTEGEGHTHGDGCHEAVSTLVCTIAEAEGHFHGEACLDEVGNVICTLEEGQGHSHEETCWITETVLVCTIAESDPHSHTEDCWMVETNVICGLEEAEGHSHEDACYAWTEELLCGMEDGQELPSETVLVCTLEETILHTHSESCYGEDGNRICGMTQVEVHIHSEACLAESEETQLICEQEEHTHDSVLCFIDNTADVETEEQWRATLPALTGVWADDLLAVAGSQVGYGESEVNLQTDAEGVIRGYTRYGAWYGEPYSDWNAIFVSFCLNYAGIDREAIAYESNAARWISVLAAREQFAPAEYIPVPGDLVFMDLDDNGLADTVAIVKSLEENRLTVYQGDTKNRAVEQFAYTLTDVPMEAEDKVLLPGDILGYGILPEKEIPVREMTAVIYTDGTYETRAEDNTVITLTGILPEDAKICAFPVSIETDDLVLCAYDIAIVLPDGTIYEPAEQENITVHIQSPVLNEQLQDESLQMEVYFVPEEGEPEKMESTTTEEGITFDADHFSVYMIRAVDTSSVETAGQLREAINQGLPNIRLARNITVEDGTLSIPDDTTITLDLNGYRLVNNTGGPLFTIGEGESLTVVDSQAGQETVTMVGGSLVANTATATDTGDAVSLTYYITHSQVTNAALGTTVETLQKHDVTASGVIRGNNQPVFRVEGGTLNLESGIVYGGTGRAVYQTSGTTNITGGYLCGFTGPETGGAVYASGGNLNISGSAVLAGNTATRVGGAVYTQNTQLSMTGGVISGNLGSTGGSSPEGDDHYGGGGMYLQDGSAVISGGYITNNLVGATGYFDGGGGILAGGNISLTVNGGYITGNEASSGGGIRTNWKNQVSLTVGGGYICSNVARTSEGGGVSINIDATCSVTGGYINNNVTNTQSDWGGGGIFCSTNSKLFIRNAMVIQNHAGGFGGGVAGCSTGRVYICVREGGAIYANSAEGQHLSGSTSTKSEDWAYAYNNEVFMNNGYQDYFCALNSIVEGAMLGGHSAEWKGSADGDVVMAGAGDTLIAAYVMGLNSNPSAQAQAAAQAVARVYINGNSSYTHGGGILCNGYMIIGITDNIDLGARIELSATKQFLGTNAEILDLEEGLFTFSVTDAQTGAILSTASNDSKGNINFKERLAFTESGTFLFYIREVVGDETDVAYDTTTYRLTVKVTEQTSYFDDILVDGSLVTISKTQYLLDDILIEKSNGGDTWTTVSHNPNPSNSEDSAIKLELTSDATFTNVQREQIEISAFKVWDPDGSHPGEVYVTLLRNGEPYGEKITLSAANDWRYTWTDLPVLSEDGETSYSYTVKEDPVPGFITEYENINSSEMGGYWLPAASLEEGRQYLLVSADGTRVLWLRDDVINAGYTTNDVAGVTPRRVTVNGVQYAAAITDDQIDPRSIFRSEITKTNSNERMLLKNMGVGGNSWILCQSANNNYLKGTTSTSYSSGVRLENGTVRFQRDWQSGNEWRTLVYRGGKFTTVTENNPSDAAKLYTYVHSSVSTTTAIRITNRSTNVVTYSLDLTKVSGNDRNVLLAGAEFQLMHAGSDVPLYFVMNAPGAYVLADSQAVGASQTMVTNINGKLVIRGLALGDYVLRETKAPNGYYPISDLTVSLGQPGEDGNVSLTTAMTIVDLPWRYEIPETGGPGTILYTMGGLLLMITAGLLLMYNQKKRRREAY